MRTVFTLFCLLGTVLGALSQSLTSSTPTHKNNPWSVSMYGGISRFYGNLREHRFWTVKESNFDSQPENGTWHGGISVQRAIGPTFGLRAGLEGGTLRGIKRAVYFSYFKADYRQIDISATLNLSRLLLGQYRTSRLSAELYGGIGMVLFRSTAYQLGSGRILRRSDTDAYFSVLNGTDGNNQPATQFSPAVAFPVGLTVNYRIFSRLKIGIDSRFNFLTTDRLDATVVPLLSSTDKYIWAAFGVTYQF